MTRGAYVKGTGSLRHVFEYAGDTFIGLHARLTRSTSRCGSHDATQHDDVGLRGDGSAAQHAEPRAPSLWALSSAGSARRPLFGWSSALPSIKGPFAANGESIGPYGVSHSSWNCDATGMIDISQGYQWAVCAGISFALELLRGS